MPSFLIVTTRDLREAYVLARFLQDRRQRFGILNITGRPLRDGVRVLRRLRRNRGTLYLADLALRKVLGAVHQPWLCAFPDVDRALAARLKAFAPHLDCVHPHGDQALFFVQRFGPDYILLAGAPVLRPALFGLARHGAYNRHLGLLPFYRGSDCPIWALAGNDVERVGFTIHVVAEKVDAGDALVTARVPVTPGWSFEEYLAEIQVRASHAFLAVVQDLIGGEEPAGTPPGTGGRYCPPAGLSTIRRASVNYARLAGAFERAPAERPVARL